MTEILLAQLGEPIDLRDLFAPDREALCDLLDTLDSAAWAAPTACPGWSVHDVAVHVLGDDVGRLAAGRDGHLTAGPGPGESLPSFLDRRNEEWVAAGRRLSARQVADQLRRSGDEVASWWASLEVDAPSLGVSWAGIDTAPVWFDAARELTEYWLHEQQIREAVGAPLRNDPPTLRRMIDVFVRGLPYALAAVDAPDDSAGVLRTSGGVEHRWVLRYGAGRWWVVGDEPAGGDRDLRSGLLDEPAGDALSAPPVWEVLVDADDLWRRWIRHRAAATLAVRTAGDPAAVAAVIDHVAIVRSPDE